MPELPEVETVVRGLAEVLDGRRLTGVALRRADLRIPFPDGFAERLVGRSVVAVRRRAKYFLWDLDDRAAVLGHLGMSGCMAVSRPGSNRPPLGPHDHVVIETDAGARIVFRDPRRFGLLTLIEAGGEAAHPLLAGLGPEPLDPAFDGAALAAALAGRRGSVKAALLDQTVVAGIGNIYASEALYRAGISPRRTAGGLGARRCARLAAAIKAVLAEAIESGGSTLRDHVRPDGELGYFQHRFAVYDRAGLPCPACDCGVPPAPGIRRIVQGGRATFYCSRRQR